MKLGFVFPTKRMIHKISDATKIVIGNHLMTFRDQICRTVDLKTLLTEFIVYLESKNTHKIVLVYENQFDLRFIPHVLMKELKKFDLIDRFQKVCSGFMNCHLFFKTDDCEFLLDLAVLNSKIKTNLPATDPFYRLDLLQRYFFSKLKTVVASKQDDVIEKFETIEDEYINYLDEEDSNEIDNDVVEEYSIEKIMDEAKNIIETKDCLTSDELRNL